jgi:hypothetical protein
MGIFSTTVFTAHNTRMGKDGANIPTIPTK